MIFDSYLIGFLIAAPIPGVTAIFHASAAGVKRIVMDT